MWKQWWSQTQTKITCLVVGCVVLVALLSKWTGNGNDPQYSKQFMRQLNRVVQQASKWHTTSKQDIEPVVRLAHSNYALAYAQTARAIASDAALEKATGLKVDALIYHLENDQRQALQNLVNVCPQVKPTGIYTTGNAWM